MVQLTLSEDGAGVTATAAAATFTCTGMDTDTPVPVKAMLPVYVPAALNDAVLKVIDKLIGFDWLCLLYTSPTAVMTSIFCFLSSDFRLLTSVFCLLSFDS